MKTTGSRPVAFAFSICSPSYLEIDMSPPLRSLVAPAVIRELPAKDHPTPALSSRRQRAPGGALAQLPRSSTALVGASVKPSEVKGAYSLSKGGYSLGGSLYTVTLNAVQSIPK